MKREAVESSNMAEIGYDPKKTLLEVLFHNGAIYQYHPFTEEQHKEMLAADSIGKWFWANVRGNESIKLKRMN
jgi:hypothetical protein